MTVSANPRSARREPACHELVRSCRALAEPNHSGRYRQVRKPQWLGSRATRAKRGPRLRRLFKQEPIYEQSAMRTLREQWQKWPSKRARQQLKIEQLRLRRPGVRHEPAILKIFPGSALTSKETDVYVIQSMQGEVHCLLAYTP